MVSWMFKRRLKFFAVFTLFFFFVNLFVPLGVFAISSCTQTNWLGSAWIYRKKINFNNGSQNENLTNFPVLVHLTSSNFEFGKARSSGQDIRFTDSDGTTLLNYEIEKWDQSGGDADVWVNVPQIDASSNTDYIYMYYGNSGAGDSQSVNATWNSNYVIVQHLKETSGTTTADSTSNGKNGTKVSATNPSSLTSGQIDGAQTFDGATSKIDIAATNATNTFTMEAWIKRGDTSSSRQFIFYVGNTDIELASSALNLNITGFGQIAIATSTITDTTTWHHVVGTRNGTTKKLYVDGVDVTGTTADSSSDLSSISAIGYRAGVNSSFFNGSIDEVRLMSTSASANWIAATYKSETDTFNSYNQEEGYRSECPPAPPAVSTCSDTAPGSAPTISSTSSGVNSVTLNWIKASDPVSYYAIEYGTTSGSYQYGASNIGNVTTYTVNSLSPKTTYFFRVRAGNGCTPGAWSNEVSSTTSGGVVVLPVSTPTPTFIPTKTPVEVQTESPTPVPTSTPTPPSVPQASPISFHLPSITFPRISLPKIGFPKININISGFVNSIGVFLAEGRDAFQKSLKRPQEFASNFSKWLLSFNEIVLDREPTRISSVKATKITSTSVVITWTTNHYSTSKVNYGVTMDYGQDLQSDTKVHDHSVTITGLKPGTKYFYEVMSQNKNYVFDAFHEFVTLEK